MYLFYFYIILFYIIYQTTHSNNVMFYSYIIFLTGEIQEIISQLKILNIKLKYLASGS